MGVSEVMLSDALDLDALEAAARVRRIRDSLLGQTLGERIAQVRARYGRVYTLATLRAAARPGWRGWFSRFGRGVMAPLEAYRAPIPDDALLRYGDASETTWFSRFCVVAAGSAEWDRPMRWIVGQLRGVELYAIVARWHTEAGPIGHPRTPNPRDTERRDLMKRLGPAVLTLAIFLLAGCAMARGPAMTAPPGGPYQKVSALVPLPDFIPGLGTLYVDPKTLPAGPFLAYDRQGNLVSSVYMIPIKDITANKQFANLAAANAKVDHVDMYYNAGHPGVAEPHYHVVLWYVSPEKAAALK